LPARPSGSDAGERLTSPTIASLIPILGIFLFDNFLTIPLTKRERVKENASKEGLSMRLKLMSAVLFSVVLGAQTQAIRSLSSNFVFLQKDTPLQVVGVQMTLDDLCNKVIVANVSQRAIVRAQFGWTISESRNPSPSNVAVSYGLVFDVTLPPGEVTGLGPQGVTITSVTDTAKQLGAQRGAVVTGVVYVKFADGTEWYYPLKERKAFVEISDPSVVMRISPKVREYRAKANPNAALRSRDGTPTACQPLKPANHSSFLTSVLGWIGLATVHAEGRNPWILVCNPAPRDCEGGNGRQCTTYFCDPYGYCNQMQCCLLNVITGELDCGS